MLKPKLIILLTLIPFIPYLIGRLHFFINGSLNWPMTWNNEMAAWTLVLSTFAVLSFLLAMKAKRYALTTLPLLAILFSIGLLFQVGLNPSSKSDSSNLEMLAFWSEQWGYW